MLLEAASIQFLHKPRTHTVIRSLLTDSLLGTEICSATGAHNKIVLDNSGTRTYSKYTCISGSLTLQLDIVLQSDFWVKDESNMARHHRVVVGTSVNSIWLIVRQRPMTMISCWCQTWVTGSGGITQTRCLRLILCLRQIRYARNGVSRFARGTRNSGRLIAGYNLSAFYLWNAFSKAPTVAISSSLSTIIPLPYTSLTAVTNLTTFPTSWNSTCWIANTTLAMACGDHCTQRFFWTLDAGGGKCNPRVGITYNVI